MLVDKTHPFCIGTPNCAHQIMGCVTLNYLKPHLYFVVCAKLWTHPSAHPCAMLSLSFSLIFLQVKSGTIFDNVLITDDEEYASEFAEETWEATKGPEKAMKDKVGRKEGSIIAICLELKPVDFPDRYLGHVMVM